MDYEAMEKAAAEIKSMITFIHGIEPSEYSIQGTAVLGHEPIISVNYSPGMEFNIPVSEIFSKRNLVIADLACLKFKPVWRKTEKGVERIYA